MATPVPTKIGKYDVVGVIDAAAWVSSIRRPTHT